MKILFDSHALVWYLVGNRRLSSKARQLADDPQTELLVSAVCVWEMATKIRKGRWSEAISIMDRLPS